MGLPSISQVKISPATDNVFNPFFTHQLHLIPVLCLFEILLKFSSIRLKISILAVSFSSCVPHASALFLELCFLSGVLWKFTGAPIIRGQA